ncbi:MAG TPA: hypothetical protein VGJ09_13745 [Bryobacteraceae bacterium]|jgi:hypothetical protein
MKHFSYLLLVALSCGTLWAADAFIGTWKLSPAKSKFPKGFETKEMTVVMAEQGANVTVTAKGVGADGKPILVKYNFPTSGGPVKYTEGGPAAGTTVVNKRIDANTFESTITINGKDSRTTSASVSKGGKTFTLTRKGADEKGHAIEGMEFYERQ